jgi:hypothetical protein
MQLLCGLGLRGVVAIVSLRLAKILISQYSILFTM